MSQPDSIVLLSGKRKSGKDFLSENLVTKIGPENCAIVRISEPIKSHYAKQKNLNLEELMSDNAYKEIYRLEMINWSEEVRKENPGYFCEAACSQATQKPLWIVSDIRRKTDINWFKKVYGEKIKCIRISADLRVRQQRGFVFTQGVDDVASECDLDDFDSWDLSVKNNNDEEFQSAVVETLHLIGR